MSNEIAMKGYTSSFCSAIGCVTFAQRFSLGAGAKFVFFKNVIALYVGIVFHCRYLLSE